MVALAARGGRIEELARAAREFRPELVAVATEDAAAALRPLLPAGVRLEFGSAALEAVATLPSADRIVAAMVGAAGVPPVAAALGAGKSVALANKEALVVAGAPLTALARRTGASIVPIDSEHVALHQALRAGTLDEVEQIVLTASGGPFLDRDPATFDAIRRDEALRHPTWSMGEKITIDSATLVNKGLELIEAHWLFDLPAERIEVVIHPRSIVHSFVAFRDGSLLAQLAPNEMRFPIQYALAYPERWTNSFARLEPAALGELVFRPVDHAKFPAITLARRALAMGDSAAAALNGANEVAVHAFLAGRIRFPEIVGTIARVLDRHEGCTVGSVEEALAWDDWGRRRAEDLLGLEPSSR